MSKLSIGFPKKDIYRDMQYDHAVLDKALECLLDKKTISLNKLGYFIPSKAPRLSGAQQKIADKILQAYSSSGFSTPRRDELPAIAGAPEAVLAPIVDHLIQLGDIVELSDKIVLHRDLLEKSRGLIINYIRQNGSLESGIFKDLIGSTRKYSIPILEYWDAQGLTRRIENRRVLKDKSHGNT